MDAPGKRAADAEIRVRADKWLWAARFCKTRVLAAEAIAGGKIHINGERVKPSRLLYIGDTITIQRGPYTCTVIVTALSARRGPAEKARSMYQETDASVAARETLETQLRAEQGDKSQPSRRPDKRGRRRLLRMNRRR